jgi:hypothetical protein
MKPKLTFALTFALAFAIAGSAWAGSFSHNDYQGRVESDPATFFGFDVATSSGTTKVKNIEAVVKLNCNDGEGGVVPVRMTRALEVRKDNTFKGNGPAQPFKARGISSPTARMSVSGKLKKHGRAAGKLDLDYDFLAMRRRGGQHVHCYSGGVSWRAKRGAVVNPQPQMRFGN